MNSLNFIVRIFAWDLPGVHNIYEDNHASVNNITLSNLIWTLGQYKVCQGISINSHSSQVKKHCIPKIFSPTTPTSEQSEYNRAKSCLLLVQNLNSCNECTRLNNSIGSSTRKEMKRKSAAILEPAKPKAPISLTSPEKIKLTLQHYRIENKQLKADIENLK